MQQADAVGGGLAQPEDATRADVEAGITDMFQGLQSLVKTPCRDDAGIKLAAGVEVVVIRRQARLLQFLGLLGVDHAQGDADLHAHGADSLDHLCDVLEAVLPTFHVPPCSAHAEPGATVLLGCARS